MSAPPTPPRQQNAASTQQQHWQQLVCNIAALENTAQWADGHPDLPAALKKHAVGVFQTAEASTTSQHMLKRLCLTQPTSSLRRVS